ncbi:MAG TPA: HlyD family efflux transporter periplasmic adaptor subunit, partial [Acetobacteraceae bacterium]|nr:HlyD family efflux transporter periplasmic adaptor subunit [Acetobacteraceae bacterium]
MTAVSQAGVFVGMDRPLARRRITLRMLLSGAILLAALAAGWMLLQQPERSFRLDASRVAISTVSTAPFHDFIPLRGKVVPLVSVMLDAVQGGRVEEVLAEAGQHVVAGQRLIRLSDPQLELDAIARETQVIAQMNSQQSLQLTFELTKTNDEKALAGAQYNIVRLSREVARRRPLAAEGFTSREKLDQSADELDYQKRMALIAGEALVHNAAVISRSNELIQKTAARLDANLAAAKAQLDTLTVRAPADGVLTALDAHIGEQKTKGQHLGQIDRDAGFKVTIQVDEFYLARVKPGEHVAATIDGAAHRLIVTKVYPQVKDGKFEIDLAWEAETPEGLRRGQAVQGKLELGNDTPATVLPAGPFLEVSGGAWVFVLGADGRSATRRPVKLGRRTAEMVEVLNGLHPGDRVVTSDYT